MLHILLLILKIIGIALAVIIGLILLILLVVLFVPVRYQGYGSKSGDNLEAKAKVTWLFGAISFSVGYAGGQMTRCIRIFGINVQKAAAFFKKRREKRALNNQERQKRRKENTVLPKDTLPPPAEPVSPAEIPELEIKAAVPEKHTERLLENKGYGVTDISLTERPGEESGTVIGRIFRVIGRWCRVIAGWIRKVFSGALGLIRKIWAIPGKILAFFRKIGLTIQTICAKINYWQEFLEDERTRGAINISKKSLVRLLKHIAPRKVKGEVTFGFEDPCTTGRLLAGICAFYPVYQDHIRLNPAFDREILEGNIKVSGRIYVFVFVRIAWVLYRNQAIRYVIKTFQHKEEA